MTDSTDPSQANQGVACPKCGFVNPAGFKFCGQCGTPLSSESLKPALAPEQDAERRHLTVLFCDLVDSVGWSQRLDPEDYRALLGRYRVLCSKAIKRYGGSHERYIGDGIRVYFGYPEAHEDDAERAVRAGLEIVQNIAGLTQPADDSPQKLAVRVGIATGMVVAGRMLAVQSDATAEAVGDTPNLAARLQSLAAPNTVVIADTTRRLLGELFELDDWGERTLKGFDQPLRVWRVQAPIEGLSRFKATRSPRTPLVNREAELAFVRERWRKALAGKGQVIVLRGEPGLGKSRLVQEARARFALSEQVTILYYQCSPHHSDSALYPVAAQLQYDAGIRPGDSLAEKRHKLMQLLQLSSADPDHDFIYLADLLGLLQADEEPELTPARRKAKLYDALLGQLTALARQQPVMLIFEDIHWIDPSSLELLQRGVDAIQELPVLMLMTARPEFEPPWRSLPHCVCFDLERLESDMSADLARNLASGKRLPDDILRYIGNRAGGNPLYVEELTKTLLQDQTLIRRDNGGYRLVGPLPDHSIPASLQDLLVARLDKLSPIKIVAQTAAVIGREFTLGLLEAVSDYARQQLRAFLEQLIDTDVLMLRDSGNGGTYVFRHGLLQEAAYDSLLRSQRQQLHHRIASVMEERYPYLWEAHPGILARHFAGAGAWPKAVHYWLQAGVAASDRSAYTEALGHLDKALQALTKLPEGQQRWELELKVQTSRGGILISTAGGGARETVAAYQRALELSRMLGQNAQDKSVVHSSFAALWGLWRTSVDLNMAQLICDQMLQLAQSQQDAALILQAYHVLWPTSFSMGKPVLALEQIDLGLRHYPVQEKLKGITEFGGHDAMVCAFTIGSLAHWLAGCPEQAADFSKRALAKAQALNHAASLVHALDGALSLAMFSRQPRLIQQYSSKMRALCEQHGLAESNARVAIFSGWGQVLSGEVAAGIERMQNGLDVLRDLGTSESDNYFLEMLAFGYQQLGQIKQGLAVLEQALALEPLGIKDWAAEVRRRKAELLILDGAFESAEGVLQEALTIAREQQAKALQLRVAVSLVELHERLGDVAQARAELRELYSGFSEGFATPDLMRARQCLEQPE